MIPDFKLIFTVSTDPRSDLGVDGEPAPPAAPVPRESEGGRTSPSGAFVKAFRAEMEAADVAYKEELRRDARLWSEMIPQASPGRTDAPSPGEDPHDPPSCGDEPATPDAPSPPFQGASGVRISRRQAIADLNLTPRQEVGVARLIQAMIEGTTTP